VDRRCAAEFLGRIRTFRAEYSVYFFRFSCSQRRLLLSVESVMAAAAWIFVTCALAAIRFGGYCCSAQDDDDVSVTRPRVRVESGELAGTVDRTLVAGRPLYAFLGVPYAGPPVHKNRFKVRFRDPARATPIYCARLKIAHLAADRTIGQLSEKR